MANIEERLNLRKRVMNEEFLLDTEEVEQDEVVEEVVERPNQIFNFRKCNKIIPDKKTVEEKDPMRWKWGEKSGTKAPVNLSEDVPDEPKETKAQKIEPGKYKVI
jgi:hypothetical protein